MTIDLFAAKNCLASLRHWTLMLLVLQIKEIAVCLCASEHVHVIYKL